MAVIRLGGFRGLMPRLHPRLLPETSSQTCINARLDSGAIESIRDTATIQATTLSNPISLFRYSSSIWLESTTDTDWIRYPVTNDTFNRVIYKDPSVDGLRVTDASIVGTGGAPASFWNLDVPAPTQGFSATLNGTPDDEDEVPETRFYVCTFVNSYGAEGPPSPASNELEWRTGQTVTLSNLPALPAGNYNISHRRIYRVNTGSTGTTNYQFVTEIAVTSSTKTVISATQANPVVVTTATAHGLETGMEVSFANFGTNTPVNITQVLKTNPVRVTTASAHGLTSGMTVAIEGLGGASGMDELDGVRGTVSIIDTVRFTINGIDATGYTTYVSGGTAARVFGMDELDDTTHFISVIDTTSFTLDGLDGTAYKPYVELGTVTQVAGTSYTDNVASESLGEVLPTELYDPPHPDMKGLVEHPGGFLAGFFGNTLCFSEIGAPHAWPIDYRQSCSHEIIGLGVFGNTVVVTTKGWPNLAVGSDPAAMAKVELELDQACSSKRGIVDFGAAVAYPSPDGLMLVSGQGATNVTAGLMTRDQWQALKPSTFVAFNWESSYLCFYDDGSIQRAFIVEPFDPQAGIVYVSKYATGGFRDIEEDLLYFIVSNNIVSWDQGSKFNYTWKSKPFHTPRAVNMSACKVTADSYPVTAQFYVDDVLRDTRVIGSNKAFRLSGGFRGEKFEVQLKGNNRVSEVVLATSMTEISATV